MNKLLIILTMFIFSGCTVGANLEPLKKYKCSADQLKLVSAEYNICDKSSFSSSYCYETAKVTQCTLIELPATETKP